jgi:TPR repeat protein
MIYYKKAAEKKCYTAFSHIGYLYEFGIGVQKNGDEAFKNYKLASDAGMIIVFLLSFFFLSFLY